MASENANPNIAYSFHPSNSTTYLSIDTSMNKYVCFYLKGSNWLHEIFDIKFSIPVTIGTKTKK